MGTHFRAAWRGTYGIISYFYAIANLPLATATTLNYTSPLFLAVATTIVLGEKFSRWLVVAIVLGFAGVAMLLQPTFEAGQAGAALLGLSSGLVASWAYLGVRALSRKGEPEWRDPLLVRRSSAPWAAPRGRPPSRPSTPSTGRMRGSWWASASSGPLAQLAMTRAYRTGNTLVVGSLSYSTIVFSTLFMVTIFGDRLPFLGWAGIVVIVASGLVALRVERKDQVEEAGFES